MRDVMTILQICFVQRIGPAGPHWVRAVELEWLWTTQFDSNMSLFLAATF